jgi:flagellar hook-basal body complex protein FliE
MGIENIGNMNKMLSSYSTEDWTKSASIDQASLPKFNELNPNQATGTTAPQSFSEMMAASIKEVNNMQVEANKAMEKLASGKTKNVSEVLLAADQAETAFKMMNQIRTKVIEAYKEIMRMQM